MPLADWTVPFELTSADYSATALKFNTPIVGSGIYLLNQQSCFLDNQVRATKENVPQMDGAILHHRFLAGMEMGLAVQLWQDTSNIACDTLLQTMLDTLMGYIYGLLNAEDNRGRISWLPDGNSSANSSQRMLDDIRLLTYPTQGQNGGAVEITFSVDCALPYAEDLTQDSVALGASVTAPNLGNRSTYPVFKIDGPFTNFILTNVSTGLQIVYDSTLPPGTGLAVGGGDYIEIDMFRNTAYLNGDQSNLKPGIDILSSDFFPLIPGNNTITLAGASTGTILINSAWA